MSKEFRTILFDLDGTLTDSSPGILNSVRFAFDKMNLEIPDDEVLNKFHGPPLTYAFTEFCGMDALQAKQATAYYRERYNDYCVIENSLYDGIYDLLEQLKSAGKNLAVATTKPEFMAEKIISHFGIRHFFTAVCGAAPDGANGKKADIIRNALEKCGETDLEQALMIGDRFYDIEGAKAVGIASVGALYGYGSSSELEEAGADY
ncbi:MAG: HAD hydrolase-like protein, partial [Oscillospiraceae bacterium]|nr:HAD hydrolase-like protein [Oscillospiraceae bacterium]